MVIAVVVDFDLQQRRNERYSSTNGRRKTLGLVNGAFNEDVGRDVIRHTLQHNFYFCITDKTFPIH